MLKDKKILLGALLSITTAPVQETYCVDGRPEEKHFKGEKNQKLSKIPVQEMIDKKILLGALLSITRAPQCRRQIVLMGG